MAIRLQESNEEHYWIVYVSNRHNFASTQSPRFKTSTEAYKWIEERFFEGTPVVREVRESKVDGKWITDQKEYQDKIYSIKNWKASDRISKTLYDKGCIPKETIDNYSDPEYRPLGGW